MRSPRAIAQVVLAPVHLRRTIRIALIVGSWLTLVNQGDAMVTQGLTPALFVKIPLNYLTPFVVSNLGLLAADKRHLDEGRKVSPTDDGSPL